MIYHMKTSFIKHRLKECHEHIEKNYHKMSVDEKEEIQKLIRLYDRELENRRVKND